MALLVTPAGLFNVAPEGVSPDLRLEVTELSPLALAQSACVVVTKPAIRMRAMCSWRQRSTGW